MKTNEFLTYCGVQLDILYSEYDKPYIISNSRLIYDEIIEMNLFRILKSIQFEIANLYRVKYDCELKIINLIETNKRNLLNNIPEELNKEQLLNQINSITLKILDLESKFTSITNIQKNVSKYKNRGVCNDFTIVKIENLILNIIR